MKKRFDELERRGVNQVEKIMLDFGWIPRNILASDVGIDMEVEIAERGVPTGKLIAVQIKTGGSYFKHTNKGSIVFYIDNTHVEYWLKHSLPVLLILYNPETDLPIWQEVSFNTVKRNKNGYKINIPAGQILNPAYKEAIAEINKLPPFLEKIQRLSIDYHLMKRISDGEKLVVEYEDWVNKTIGKAGIRVVSVGFFFEEEVLMESSYIFFSGVDDLKHLFPWADFSVDEDFYEEHDEDEWRNNYATYDKEDNCYRSTLSFDEYKKGLQDIRPIQTFSSEIDFYRLELSLNKLGSAFVTLNENIKTDALKY